MQTTTETPPKHDVWATTERMQAHTAARRTQGFTARTVRNIPRARATGRPPIDSPLHAHMGIPMQMQQHRGSQVRHDFGDTAERLGVGRAR